MIWFIVSNEVAVAGLVLGLLKTEESLHAMHVYRYSPVMGLKASHVRITGPLEQVELSFRLDAIEDAVEDIPSLHAAVTSDSLRPVAERLR
jgi:hypothetical protein